MTLPSGRRGLVLEARARSSKVDIPSAAEWNSAPTLRSGQYASGARSSTTSAVERPSEPCCSRRPDDDGDQGHRDGRDELERDRRGERDPERLHRRVAVAVGDPSGSSATAPPPGGRRPASAGPFITSRKWPDSADSTRHCRSDFSLVAMPMSAAKIGISGRVDDHDPGREQVLARDGHDGQRRQHGRQREAGR